MQVSVNIDDAVWDEYLELTDKKERIEEITKEALKEYIRRMKKHYRLPDSRSGYGK